MYLNIYNKYYEEWAHFQQVSSSANVIFVTFPMGVNSEIICIPPCKFLSFKSTAHILHDSSRNSQKLLDPPSKNDQKKRCDKHLNCNFLPLDLQYSFRSTFSYTSVKTSTAGVHAVWSSQQISGDSGLELGITSS